MSFQDPDDRERRAAATKARCAAGNHIYSREPGQPRPRLCVNCSAREPGMPIVADLPRVDSAPPVASAPHAMTRIEVDSLREWLAHWGDGPNWSDKTGATVPITKTALRRLLDAASAFVTLCIVLAIARWFIAPRKVSL